MRKITLDFGTLLKKGWGYLLLPGERGETKLSKARWSETERAKDRTINRTKKERDFSPSNFNL
jgi:hypothetical protein